MAEATSPTSTACNQMQPGSVREKDRGRRPRRSEEMRSITAIEQQPNGKIKDDEGKCDELDEPI